MFQSGFQQQFLTGVIDFVATGLGRQQPGVARQQSLRWFIWRHRANDQNVFRALASGIPVSQRTDRFKMAILGKIMTILLLVLKGVFDQYPSLDLKYSVLREKILLDYDWSIVSPDLK